MLERSISELASRLNPGGQSYSCGTGTITTCISRKSFMQDFEKTLAALLEALKLYLTD